MATEVHLGDFSHFDSFTGEKFEQSTPHDLSLFTSSSLSGFDISFEGDTYSGESATADLKPMAAYAKAAQASADFLKAAKMQVLQRLEEVQESQEEAISTFSTLKTLEKLQANVVSAELVIKEFDDRQAEIDEECVAIQAKATKLQREGFHKKLEVFDEEIKEIRESESAYVTIIDQDRSLLADGALGKMAYDAALGLKAIYTEGDPNERESLQARFGERLSELAALLDAEKLERFSDKIQEIVLQQMGLVLSGEVSELRKQDFTEEVEKIVSVDYKKYEAALVSLDAANKILMNQEAKSEWLDATISSFQTDTIIQLEAQIAELQDEQKVSDRAELVAGKKVAERYVEVFQKKIAAETQKDEETKLLLQKLDALDIDETLQDIRKMNFEEVDIAELDNVTLAITEASGQREHLILLRGTLVQELKTVSLGMDEVSVDIAVGCDVDKLFILKSNYLKEKLLNIKKLEQAEKQENQLIVAMHNIESLQNGLGDVKKFITETGLQKEYLSLIEQYKADLSASKEALGAKKTLLKDAMEEFEKKLSNANEGMLKANSKIAEINPGLALFAQADNLASNYANHIRVLEGIKMLLEHFKENEARKLFDAAEEEAAGLPDDRDYEDEVFEEVDGGEGENLGDLDFGRGDSIMAEFAAVNESIDFERGPSLADEFSALDESLDYEAFADGVQEASTPVKKKAEPVVVHSLDAEDMDGVSKLARKDSVKLSAKAAAPKGLEAAPIDAVGKLTKLDSNELGKVEEADGNLGADAPKGLEAAPIDAVGKLTKLDSNELGKVEEADGNLGAEDMDGVSKLARKDSVKLIAKAGAPKGLEASPIDAVGKLETLDSHEVAKVEEADGNLGAEDMDGVSKLARKDSVKLIAKAAALKGLESAPIGNIDQLRHVASVDLLAVASNLGGAVGEDLGSSKTLAGKDHTASSDSRASILKALAGEAIGDIGALDFARIMCILGGGAMPAASALDVAFLGTHSKSEIMSRPSEKVELAVGGNGGGGGVDFPKVGLKGAAGTLAVDTGDIHAKTPIIEHRGFMPAHIDPGPSMPDRVYSALAATINAGSGEADHKVHVQQEQVAPRSRTSDIVQKMLTKQAGMADSLGGADISLSRYSAEELIKLTSNGHSLGNRLLWAIREQLIANSGLDIDMLQKY